MPYSVNVHFVLMPNVNKDELFRGLLEYCSNQSGVAFKCQESHDTSNNEYCFDLKFKDHRDAKLYLYDFIFAMNNPDHDYAFITKSDFAIEATDQDMINFISTQLHRSTQFDIDLLDLICSDLAYSQTKNDERLDQIEQYLIGSGIIHYKQFMKELLTLLDAKDLVDKDSIIGKMFKTLH